MRSYLLSGSPTSSALCRSGLCSRFGSISMVCWLELRSGSPAQLRNFSATYQLATAHWYALNIFSSRTDLKRQKGKISYGRRQLRAQMNKRETLDQCCTSSWMRLSIRGRSCTSDWRQAGLLYSRGQPKFADKTGHTTTLSLQCSAQIASWANSTRA